MLLTYFCQAENVDGANNDVRARFINVSNHNAGTGHLDNQGPSAKDSYLFNTLKHFKSTRPKQRIL